MSARSSHPAADIDESSFGRRLRSERERRRIALEAVAANTKIGISLLKGLERDDVSRWPSGIFRRSFLKSYAEAVGLDPDKTLQEFLERFPDAQEPEPVGRGGGRKAAPTAVLRLTLADSRPPFSGGIALSGLDRRLLAAAWDGGTMLVLALTAFALIDQFWMPLGVVMLCYYLGGILLLGNTPGVCLFAPRSHDEALDASGDDAPAESTPEPALKLGLGSLLR
jgi:transcriptional regulator with XRE-family HTH domain